MKTTAEAMMVDFMLVVGVKIGIRVECRKVKETREQAVRVQ